MKITKKYALNKKEEDQIIRKMEADNMRLDDSSKVSRYGKSYTRLLFKEIKEETE